MLNIPKEMFLNEKFQTIRTFESFTKQGPTSFSVTTLMRLEFCCTYLLRCLYQSFDILWYISLFWIIEFRKQKISETWSFVYVVLAFARMILSLYRQKHNLNFDFMSDKVGPCFTWMTISSYYVIQKCCISRY